MSCDAPPTVPASDTDSVPAPATPRDHRGLPDRDQVGQQLAGVVVQDGGPRREREDEVLARGTVSARPLAATARRRLEVVLEAEVAEGRLAGIDREVDRSASPAVAAVGPAARDVCLAPECRGSVAAVAGLDEDRDAVEEHRC